MPNPQNRLRAAVGAAARRLLFMETIRGRTLAIVIVAGALGPPFSGSDLFAQSYSIPGVTSNQPTAGSSNTESRPSNRDPRYVPPLVPEYLRRKIAPGANILLSTGGDLSIEALLRAQAAAREQKKTESRYAAREFSETADSAADRSRFETDVLRQFGIRLPGLAQTHSHYEETAGRRFQVVFFLSLPITAAFSYGLVTAAKGTFGRSSGLDNGETIAVGVGGLLGAAFIAWRDLRLWQAAETERLRKESGALAPSGKDLRGASPAAAMLARNASAHAPRPLPGSLVHGRSGDGGGGAPVRFAWSIAF